MMSEPFATGRCLCGPSSDLKLAKYHTHLSVDITDSNAQLIITPGAKILRQAILKDALPWIVLTLFDTSE